MLPAGLIGARVGCHKDLEVSQQALPADNVEEAAQVVGRQHQAHVGRGALHAFLGEHVAVAPLPLDGAEGVLDDGLPPPVELRVALDVTPVELKEGE